MTAEPVDVARLEALAEKLDRDEYNQGVPRGAPWRVSQGPSGKSTVYQPIGSEQFRVIADQVRYPFAEVIAEFRNAAPSLLAAYRERDELRETVEEDAQKIDRLHRAWLAVDALFSGGPDTACRTVWQDGVECVSVPIADLRAALDGAE